MGRLRCLGGALVLAGCGVLGLLGCGRVDAAGYLAHGDGGTGGTPTVCAEQLFDGECNAAPPCCVKRPTAPLEGPSWVKIVAEPDALGSCPEPTTKGFMAYAEMKPIGPHTCGACSCSPAVCTLPEGIHTNAAPCADADGSIAVPLGPDPAAGWEGACSEDGALPANLQCDGEPCAQSVSVPTVPVAPCHPESGPAEPFPDPAWGRMALQCKIDPLPGKGCESSDVCAPPPPEGFALCLHVKGEHPTCPAEYPAHMVFYLDVKDERGCEDCQCSPQQGAECMAFFQMYSDTACSAPAGAVVVSDQDDSCIDVIPGTALASFEASMLTGVPGSCAQSGGTPFGDVQPIEPLTLCCQGDAEAPG